MPTNTTNLNLKKPIVGADEDLWGGYINDNLDDLDDYLSGNTAIPALDVTGTVTSGGLTVNGDGSLTTSSGAVLKLENSTTALTTGSVVGDLQFYANDSSTNATGAKAFMKATSETSGGTNIGITIATSDSGSATGLDRLRIASNGDIQFLEDTGTTAKFVWDASAESLGIGTSSPSADLHISSSAGSLRLEDADNGYYGGLIQSGGALYIDADLGGTAGVSGNMRFRVNGGTEAGRIDSSGNLLVGRTSLITTSSTTDTGHDFRPSGVAVHYRDSSASLFLGRQGSDGDFTAFYKSGSSVGSIGVTGGGLYTYYNSRNTGYLANNGSMYYAWDTARFYPNDDNLRDLGLSTRRWDDVYATNGTIQTSDEREKQDIAELDEAERRVAVSCKGLLRKFRWKDQVAEKGDNARIHFGIIAQDLKAAFEAEGLDAGNYAMFIHTTWWESTEVIPAVAEELDDEGNVITEAQPERTVTHHHETQEEAPAGAVQRDRMGVRYPELLAFIIAAM